MRRAVRHPKNIHRSMAEDGLGVGKPNMTDESRHCLGMVEQTFNAQENEIKTCIWQKWGHRVNMIMNREL